MESKCRELGVNVALSEVWAKGGEGGVALAKEVIRLVEEPSEFHYSYELEGSIEDKLNQIVRKIYHGNGAVLTANAQKQAQELEAMGFETVRSVLPKHSTALLMIRISWVLLPILMLL